MALYRQITRIGDNAGEIVWEFVVSADYNELIGSTAEISEVDIFDFESIKFDAEDNSLRQKEDELSFGMNEATISTPADEAAAALIKTSQYSDVWVALFAHDATDWQATSRSADKLLFSGLIRRKSSGQDLIWHGDEWSNAPAPLRSWKYSAQSFGEAILDKVILPTKKDSETKEIKIGVLDKINLSPISSLKINYRSPNSSGYSFSMFQNAIPMNDVIFSLVETAKAEIATKIPGFEMSVSFGHSSYLFGFEAPSDTAPELAGVQLAIQNVLIDHRLISPLKAADGMTIAPDYAISWHRYENFTALLYNLAVCFGCQLKIKQTGAKSIHIDFKQVTDGIGEEVELIDASSATIDLQENEKWDDQGYYCQASDLCNEGTDFCRKEEGTDGETYLSRNKLPGNYSNQFVERKGTPMPLCLAKTIQFVEVSGGMVSNPFSTPRFQNCDDPPGGGNKKTHKAAWAGMIYPFNADYYPVTRAFATVDGITQRFEKLSDLLNSKSIFQKKKYQTELKLELPFIKSLRKAGGSPDIKNLQLFNRIKLDNVTYLITGIEIKPMEARVSLKLSNSSKFGLTQPLPPTARPLGKTGIRAEDELDNSQPIETFLTAEAINAGDLVMLSSERKIKKYENKTENYGRYVGVAATSAVAGAQVVVRNSGTSAGVGLSIGKPVYARIVGGVCKPSPQRLTARSATEQTDICIGWAKSVDTWELRPPIEFELTN